MASYGRCIILDLTRRDRLTLPYQQPKNANEMAELKGPFLFTGSIGNIRAYYNKTIKRFVLSKRADHLQAA